MARYGVLGRLRWRGRGNVPTDPTDIESATVQAGSPIDQDTFPRLLTNPSGLTALRTKIKAGGDFQTRWQTAVTQFESASGYWTTKPNDRLTAAFAAFLMMVRRPGGTADDDLGLNWATDWQTYRDAIVTKASGWARSGKHEQTAIATAVIYDCLRAGDDLTAGEITSFQGWLETGFANHKYLSKSVEVWDNGASDAHAAKTLCALVSTTAETRFTEAYDETIAIAETNNWMGFGFGLGREWHDGYPSRWGLPLQLYALRYSAGLNDALTIDFMLTHLRDIWWASTYATIPHPSVGTTNGSGWWNEVFHMQDPMRAFHRKTNAAASMLWSATILPGKVELDGTGLSDQATLADSETDYLGVLWHYFTLPIPGGSAVMSTITNVTRLGGSVTDDVARFWAFPAWLIHDTDERTAITPANAGWAMVRRWWPGTLDWTFIHSDDFDHNGGSVIKYTHRRYAASNYERGCNQNGRWTVHRDGPLLLQRGETGHGVTTRFWAWCANGCVTFIDPDLYPLFTYNGGGDEGGTREFTAGDTKSQILANAVADFGPVTSWYADADVVAISSNLTRSYNSSAVQYGTPVSLHEAKISSFHREFVTIRRGGDGTDREKVFTFDRIQLLDTKFEPRYNLCPATEPDIDGTESEVTPWGPDQSDVNYDWYASGPTHWDYSSATRLIYDNVDEPDVSQPGNGKVCVTWLEPSGADVNIRKAGGTNAVSKVEPTHSGFPFFSPWRGWPAENQHTDDWNDAAGLAHRAYVGLYTVTVTPADVAAWNTAGGHFLIVCEVMAASDTPATVTGLNCDTGSKAARCGPSAVVFSVSASGHTSGDVDITSGVTLVVFANLTRAATYTLTATGGLSITTAGRTASGGDTVSGTANAYGRLSVGVSGAGNLAWAED